MNPDFGKQAKEFEKQVLATIQAFPKQAGIEAVNFAMINFRQKAYNGNVFTPWKPRKKTAKRNDGRALLVDTGRGRRSVRSIADKNGFAIVSDTPYMKVHNEGFRGVVTVPEHARVASRKVSTRYLKNGKASTSKSSLKKIRGASHSVKAHTKRMNIPQRQFIGDSPYLMAKLERTLTSQLLKI